MSEEENILDMADSDIDSMSPEEAQHHIDVVMRAGPEHPYFSNANLKAHRQAGEKMTRLYQVASPDEPQTNAEGEVLVQQWPRHMVKIMGEALQEAEAEQEKKRQARYDRADKIVAELIQRGYEPIDLPDDPPEYRIDGWEKQLLADKSDWAALTPKLAADLDKLKAPEYKRAEFQSYRSTPPGEEKLDKAEHLIFWIDTQYEKRFSVKTKKPTPETKEQ